MQEQPLSLVGRSSLCGSVVDDCIPVVPSGNSALNLLTWSASFIDLHVGLPTCVETRNPTVDSCATIADTLNRS